MSNFLENFFKNAEKRPSYVSAKTCLKIAKNIERVMEEKNINNAALAELLGCSKPYITKILRGDANLTIETLAKLSIALDCEPVVELKQKNAEHTLVSDWFIQEKFNLNLAISAWDEIFKAGLIPPKEKEISNKKSATIYRMQDYKDNAIDASCSAA